MSRFHRSDDSARRVELADARDAAATAAADASRLRSVIDEVPIGIAIADASGAIEFRNQAATASGHADLLLRDAIDRVVSMTRGGAVAEERLSLFGPPPRVMLVRAAPFGDGGALVTVDDLSERARLDAIRTDFVSNISHELKTPVGALALLAEALVDSDDAEVNRRLATRMVDEAHRAAGTIDDLLELARIELSGSGDGAIVEIDDIAEEVVARHRLTAESMGVELHVDVPESLAVRGDRLQLVSAVSNLVDNAVKYSNRGGVVALSGRAVGDVVEISVSDEGAGIPARDLDRIFERFYRVDRARSRDTGGTGLGLAIVRHVASNHGGDVAVKSHEGEGSTFTLRIPLPGVHTS